MNAYGSGLGFNFGVSFCGLYCPNVIVFSAFMGTPGAVNVHHFVWKLFNTIYKFSFIHSLNSRTLKGSGWSYAREKNVLVNTNTMTPPFFFFSRSLR